MNIKITYLSIGTALIIGVVIVLLLSPDDQRQAVQDLPPGHPDIGAMQQDRPGADEPSKVNVRTEFLERLDRLRKMVAAAPENDTTNVYELARMLTDAHQVAEARPLWERYVKANPKNVGAWLELSNVYFELEAFEKALSATRSIIGLEPANTMAMYNLGAIYATMDNKAEARKVWEDLIRHHPNSEDAKRASEMMKKL